MGQGMAIALAEDETDVMVVEVIDSADTRDRIQKLGRKCATIENRSLLHRCTVKVAVKK